MDEASTERSLGAGEAPLPRKRLAYLAAFYLGIPVAFAFFLGGAESGSFSFVEKRYYFLYFLAATLPAWWAMDICTRIVRRLLQPWSPNFFVILALGAIAGLNLQGLWAPFRQSLFVPYLAEGSSFYSVFPWRYSDPDYLAEALIVWATGSTIWIAVNLFFIYVLQFPRFGYRAKAAVDPPRSNEQTPAGPEQPSESGLGLSVLLDKLPDDLGTEIVALKAEEHYTRVYTRQGETLVLMRFSDAVGLLNEVGGLQTHRSYWANPAYIKQLVREGRSSHIELTTGLAIPVSRSYRVKVQEAVQHSAAD